jgi:hypothetical protein
MNNGEYIIDLLFDKLCEKYIIWKRSKPHEIMYHPNIHQDLPPALDSFSAGPKFRVFTEPEDAAPYSQNTVIGSYETFPNVMVLL